MDFIDFRSRRRKLLDADLKAVEHRFVGTVLDIGGGRERGRARPPEVEEWITVDVNSSFGPTVLGDAHTLPVGRDSVNTIKCTEVLEHLSDPEAAIDEMARVLKPGGILVLSVPFLYQLHGDPFDYHRFTDRRLEELLSENFDIVQLNRQGSFFTVLTHMLESPIIGTRWPWRRLLYPILPVIRSLTLLDSWGPIRRSAFYQSFTTGFFVVARHK